MEPVTAAEELGELNAQFERVSGKMPSCEYLLLGNIVQIINALI